MRVQPSAAPNLEAADPGLLSNQQRTSEGWGTLMPHTEGPAKDRIGEGLGGAGHLEVLENPLCVVVGFCPSLCSP